MSSFIDFLWNGSPPPSVTSTTSSYESMPDWYQAYQKGILAKGNAVANEQYVNYGGPRISGFTPDQTNSFQMVRDNANDWRPSLDAGMGMTGQAAAGFNQNDYSKWMSPYTSGVVDRIADLGARNLTENILPGVNDTFTGAGQFGSRRHGEFTNRAVRDTNESIMGQQALALQQATDSAMSNYQSDLTRKLNAGNQMSNMSQLLQQMGLTDAAALESVGQQQQSQNQKNLDLAYQDFTEQRDWPKNQVNWMSNLLGNQAVGQQQASNTIQPGTTFQPSGLSQMAGLYSLFKGMKKGGRVADAPVKRMAMGGSIEKSNYTPKRITAKNTNLSSPMLSNMELMMGRMGYAA